MKVLPRTIQKIRLDLILLGALISSGAGNASEIADAAPKKWPEPPSKLEMQPVEDLRQDPLDTKLGNGAVANPINWPASFYATFQTELGEASCTATLVAPRSLLTAAHCITDGGIVSIDRKGTRYRGECTRPKDGYPDVISLDVAMCLMEVDVPAYSYESINLDPAVLKPDMRLLLAGFGCTFIGGQSDGKFRIGPAFVEAMPKDLAAYPHWLATSPADMRGDSFICPGDSGGAVFVEQVAADRRMIIAVNSHYDTAARGISFLTALSALDAATFVRDWAERTGQRLCGVHPDAQACR